MDQRELYDAIRQLYAEKEKLDRTIAVLEEVESPQHGSARPRLQRRGRKSMNTKERQEVSARMKNYWAKRRAEPEIPA